MDSRDLVQPRDLPLDLVQLLRRGQIGLVQQDQVGERDLLARFRRLLQLIGDVFRIDHRHDAVQRELAPELLVAIEALRDRARARRGRWSR